MLYIQEYIPLGCILEYIGSESEGIARAAFYADNYCGGQSIANICS